MKLVTFQSLDAVIDLLKKGYLECDKDKLNVEKYGHIYSYIVKKMNERIDNPNNTAFPLWCWVKCYNGICPAKKKGKKAEDINVKITFQKNENDVFITDYRRYSFLLSNTYIPNSIKEKNIFEEKLKKYSITKDELKAYVRKDKYKECRMDKDFIQICDEIENTFERCITKDSDVLQGCVWRINIDEVEKIEILKDDGYIYGTLNYIRSNGKRFNWQKDYYKKLKNRN